MNQSSRVMFLLQKIRWNCDNLVNITIFLRAEPTAPNRINHKITPGTAVIKALV